VAYSNLTTADVRPLSSASFRGYHVEKGVDAVTIADLRLDRRPAGTAQEARPSVGPVVHNVRFTEEVR